MATMKYKLSQIAKKFQYNRMYIMLNSETSVYLALQDDIQYWLYRVTGIYQQKTRYEGNQNYIDHYEIKKCQPTFFRIVKYP